MQSCHIFTYNTLCMSLPICRWLKIYKCEPGSYYFNCNRIVILEWNRTVYIKTGLGYTKFSQIIVSIVLAYLRINIYANFKLMHRSPFTYTSMYNPSIRNQHFPPKPWFITNLFFLPHVFATWDHHEGYHRKFEVEITDM